MKKNCIRCGKEFEAKHPSRKYCPGSCKQYAYYERKGMNFGNSVNPATDAEEVKAVEDDQISEENNPVIEIPATEEVNPVMETPVKEEKPFITPFTEEKVSPLPEIKKPEKTPMLDLPKQKSEPSITLTLEQLESLLAKAKKENQQEKVVVVEKQILVPAPVKEVKDEIKKPETVVSPQPNPQKEMPQMNKSIEKVNELKTENIFTKENYPNWYYSQWENVKYVNERVKSHFKKLTEFTKRTVDISMVKYISQKMNDLIESVYFRYLPADYPLTAFIKEMAGRMEKYIRHLENEEIEKVKVGLNEETYLEMKSISAKIGTTAADVNHSTPSAETKSTYNRYERRARMRELGFNPKHT